MADKGKEPATETPESAKEYESRVNNYMTAAMALFMTKDEVLQIAQRPGKDLQDKSNLQWKLERVYVPTDKSKYQFRFIMKMQLNAPANLDQPSQRITYLTQASSDLAENRVKVVADLVKTKEEIERLKAKLQQHNAVQQTLDQYNATIVRRPLHLNIAGTSKNPPASVALSALQPAPSASSGVQVLNATKVQMHDEIRSFYE
mmetsp:Transcript_36110/g.69241  ORF Transcript_36110/g.69241 Transcript_36110/m.69241 type:complete len:203 (+) Transcript_36110:119-727(+)